MTASSSTIGALAFGVKPSFPRPGDADRHTILPLGYEGLWNPEDAYVFNAQSWVFSHSVQVNTTTSVSLRVGLTTHRKAPDKWFVSRCLARVTTCGESKGAVGLTTPPRGLSGMMAMNTDGSSWLRGTMRRLRESDAPRELKMCLDLLGGFFNYLATFSIRSDREYRASEWKAVFESHLMDWDRQLLRMMEQPMKPVDVPQLYIAMGLKPGYDARVKLLRAIVQRNRGHPQGFEDLSETFLSDIAEGPDPQPAASDATLVEPGYRSNPYDGLALSLIVRTLTSVGVLSPDIQVTKSLLGGTTDSVRISVTFSKPEKVELVDYTALKEFGAKLFASSSWELKYGGRFKRCHFSFLCNERESMLADVAHMNLFLMRTGKAYEWYADDPYWIVDRALGPGGLPSG